jgi:magnesium-transporting ATPase (P-type)
MKSRLNLSPSNIAIVVMGVSLFFNNIKWLAPSVLIALVFFFIIVNIVHRARYDNKTWIGFGKKHLFFIDSLILCFLGILSILVSNLFRLETPIHLYELNNSFYMGCLFIIIAFGNIRTYPIVLKGDTFHFRSIAIYSESIQLNKIVGCSCEEKALIIETKKRTIRITKTDIPICPDEFERIAKKINEYIRHNKKHYQHLARHSG